MSQINISHPRQKSKRIEAVIAVVLSIFSVISFGIIHSLITPKLYFGDDIFTYTPTSLVIFALNLIILLRFLNTDVLSDTRRIIIACITGLFLSIATLTSSEMIYGTHSIVESSYSMPVQILTILGMTFFFTPLTSEIMGVFNFFSIHELSYTQPSKVFFYEKNNTVYFFTMWAVFFLSFLPMFLYAWPGNFIADAGYQLFGYIENYNSTHHPLLHTLLMGVFYERGLNAGNIPYFFQFYTLTQILILSASFAFFMKYLKEKKVSRILRIAIFAFFSFNPVVDYFAVSTVKGVLASAFLIFSITFFLYIVEGRFKILNSVLFVLSSILSCHFRNNMIYAIVVTLVIIAFFMRDIKFKALMLTLTIMIYIFYKLTLSFIVKVSNATYDDSARESLSVPIMCLAHVAIDKKDELDPIIYNEICMYLDEKAFSNYTYCLADPIKNSANEGLLKTNTLNYMKLFIKVGLKYPGKYLEAFCGLSCGFYAPLNSPYFLSASTKFYTMDITDGYPSPAITNRLPFGSFYYDFMFGDAEGRLKIPLLGFLWRNSTYFWGYVFAFMYLIYKKKYINLFVLLFPFLYMMTCLFGPATFMRYLYINISTMGIALFLIIHKDLTSSAKVRG